MSNHPSSAYTNNVLLLTIMPQFFMLFVFRKIMWNEREGL